MKAAPFVSLDAPHPPLSSREARRSRRAFTLVEVVLAIGVVAFAFVGIFSLLPAGLTLFREAMDTSVTAQIAQRIVSEAGQSDFDSLVPEDGNVVEGVTKGGSAAQFYALPLRYFDDQGTELGVSSGSGTVPTLTNDEALRVVYTVRVRGALPGAADPREHDNESYASLPASADADAPNPQRFNPRFVTFLTIQVVKNPGRLDLGPSIDEGTFLITPKLAREKNFPVKTFPAIVARNSYRNAS